MEGFLALVYILESHCFQRSTIIYFSLNCSVGTQGPHFGKNGKIWWSTICLLKCQRAVIYQWFGFNGWTDAQHIADCFPTTWSLSVHIHFLIFFFLIFGHLIILFALLVDLATSCYEYACGKFLNNLEIMMGLFNCYVREYSFVKQQQVSCIQ